MTIYNIISKFSTKGTDMKIPNKEAKLIKPGHMEIINTQFEEPPLKREWVRIQIDYCGICGSDLNYFNGIHKSNFPLSLGHEYCGTIVQVGSAVQNLSIGEWVAVDINYRCGSCQYCKEEQSHLCKYGSINLFTNYGFSNFVDLHNSYIVPMIPPSPLYFGALLEPLSCAIHSVELSRKDNFNRILVLGCGAMGVLITYLLSQHINSKKVFVSDINRKRGRSAAKALQANWINITEIPKQAFSLVFDVTGSIKGLQSSFLFVSKGGSIVVMSRNYNTENFHLPIESLQEDEITIRWSHVTGPVSCVNTAKTLLKSKSLYRTIKPCVDVIKLKDIQAAFLNYERRIACKLIIDCREE